MCYWLFNSMEVHPNKQVTSFIVRSLDRGMTYEPVFTKKSGSSASASRTQTGAAQTGEAAYCQVTCVNCTFSGGGYSGKVPGGYVPAGSTIRFYAPGKPMAWRINGKVHYDKPFGSAPFFITRTVNSNIRVEALMGP